MRDEQKQNRKLMICFTSLLVIAYMFISGVFLYGGCTSKPKEKGKKPRHQWGKEVWKEEKIVIPGRYCDAEVVKLDDGRYRMYFSIEPEVPNNQLEMYSAVSKDGLTWTQEEGVRMRWSTFPSVIKLSDGRWRMYYQNQGVIKSSISADGLNWTEEEGTRVGKGKEGSYDSFNVASPTVVQLKDGTYKMYYRGGVKGKYDPHSDQEEITRILSATSSDGLDWRKDEGIVVDSTDEELRGQVDGPEAVIWDDGTLKLYFMSYEGIYVTEISDDGKASLRKKVLEAQGPEHAPSDPTIIRIGKTWRMYFGIHTKGIYIALLEE